MPSDVLNVSTSSSEDDLTSNLYYVRDFVLNIIYIIIGIVGILDNLFVIIIFAFFIKVADKVLTTHSISVGNIIQGGPKSKLYTLLDISTN